MLRALCEEKEWCIPVISGEGQKAAVTRRKPWSEDQRQLLRLCLTKLGSAVKANEFRDHCVESAQLMPSKSVDQLLSNVTKWNTAVMISSIYSSRPDPKYWDHCAFWGGRRDVVVKGLPPLFTE